MSIPGPRSWPAEPPGFASSEPRFDLHIIRQEPRGEFRVFAKAETLGHVEGTVTPPLPETSELIWGLADEGRLSAVGAALHRSLFTGAVGSLFDSALGTVLAREHAALSLRLRIDPPELSVLPWELLFDPQRSRFLAAWSKTLLSRDLSIDEPVRPLVTPAVVRLLALAPRSSLLARLETDQELQALTDRTEGRIEVRRLDGPVTLKAVREALRRTEFHLIHFAGHATLDEAGAALFLDSEEGDDERISATAFSRLLQDHESIRLVVLNACQGAARSASAALAGLAPQLLRHGVPAVIAMQAPISDVRAVRFAAELYAELTESGQDGQVEKAVTRARGALLQEHPGSPDFANPVLYLRSEGGRLWQPGAKGRDLPTRPVITSRLPLPPPSFLGRNTDLRTIKERLRPAPGGPAERGNLLIVTGWPGVGKTTMTMALANDPELRQAFPDGVLWTSLERSPNLLVELNTWCIALGSPSLRAGTTIGEASLELGSLLRRRRVLLLLDDVWEPAHAVPFLVGGPECAMLVTSRLNATAEQLAPSPPAIYRLPPLTDEAGLEILRSRAPQVVVNHPEECRVLVGELEGLPLSLHVAGRMLSAESHLWSPGELIANLREGRKLLEEKAPSDRTDLESQALPTVAVLLGRSTERLPPDVREHFAFLGVFAPKPATFDLDSLQAVWEAEDPKPMVRTLVQHGLLEPVGDGRFHLHALLAAHARSLLED